MSRAAESTLEVSSAAPKPRGRVLLLLLGICLFAFALRALFVIEVFASNTEDQILKLHFDSREYHHLARNLAETGQYQIDTRESRFFALLRTPGYPAIVALFLKLGLGIKGLVWAQAILSSLIPPLVFLLGRWIFRDLLFAGIAGVIAALSTTGIGLSAMLLADLPFAFTIISGFAALYLGASGRRWAWISAGLIFSLAILIKPATMYFAPALAIAWWMIARSQRLPMRWPALLWVLAAPYIAVALWSMRNHAQTGHWVFSTVDAQNLRHFVAPFTEELNKAGGLPNDDSLNANHHAAMRRDIDDVMMGQISAADLALRQRAEAKAVILAHPMWTGFGLIFNSLTCFHDAWSWTPEQLKLPSLLRSSVYRLNRLEIHLRFPMLGLGLLILAERLLLRQRRREGSLAALSQSAAADARRETRAVGACAIVLAYFVVISGTSFSTGFRIIYPAEFALILLALGGVRSGIRMMRALK